MRATLAEKQEGPSEVCGLQQSYRRNREQAMSTMEGM
jgi:hypothetical protein